MQVRSTEYSSFHPPSIVHLNISPCNSPTAVPDSPLSSAPNSPVPAENENNELRLLEDILQEQQHAVCLQMPPPPLGVAESSSVPLQRQNSEVQLDCRESRKSRLRASMNQARCKSSSSFPQLEEKKSDESSNCNHDANHHGGPHPPVRPGQHRTSVDVLADRPVNTSALEDSSETTIPMEEDEGDELPLLPSFRHKEVVSPPVYRDDGDSLLDEVEPTKPVEEEGDELPLLLPASFSRSKMIPHREEDDSPLDEVDELLVVGEKSRCDHAPHSRRSYAVEFEHDETEDVVPQQQHRRILRWNNPRPDESHTRPADADIGTSPVEIRKRRTVVGISQQKQQQQNTYIAFPDVCAAPTDEGILRAPAVSSSSSLDRPILLAPSYDEAGTSREEDIEVAYISDSFQPDPYDEGLEDCRMREESSSSSSSNASSVPPPSPPKPRRWKQPRSHEEDDDYDLHAVPTDEMLSHYKKSSRRKESLAVAPRHANKIILEDDKEPLLHVGQEDVPMDEILLDLSFATNKSSPDRSFFKPVEESERRQSPPSLCLPKQGTPLLVNHNNTRFGTSKQIPRPNSPMMMTRRTVLPGSDAANAIAVVDLTETTTAEDEHTLPILTNKTSIMDVSTTSSDESNSNGPIMGPMLRREQHRPLLQPEDFSSSDETPMMTNGLGVSSSSQARRKSRKNRVYGEANLHGYWRKQQGKQQRQQQMSRRKYDKSREASAEGSCLSPDRLLPPLVVDSDQLRSIGVNAMLAVCNGIGSLFVSNQEANESLKHRRPTPVEMYKKLLPENPGSRKRHSRASRGNQASLETGELWRHEWSQQSASKAAAIFEAALQRSIEAELSAGGADRCIVTKNAGADRTNTAPQCTATQQEGLDQQYAFKRTQSLPVPTTSRAQKAPGGWWIEDELSDRLKAKDQADALGRATSPTILAASVEGGSSQRLPKPLAAEEEGWSLAREIEKRANRKPSSAIGVAERIAALPRISRSTEKGVSNPSVVTHVIKDPAKMGNKNTASDKIESQTGARPSIDVTMTHHPVNSPEIDYPDKGATSIPVTPRFEKQTQPKDVLSSTASKSGHTAVLTPLTDPPKVRRLNVSMDFEESLGPEFSSEVVDDGEPPSLSRPVKNEKAPSSPNAQKPDPERSPMSDFLASRMNANKTVLIVEGTPATEVGEDLQSFSNDSDGSSTGELLSSLDVLVEDLNGLASARRIERSFTSDSRSTDALLFSERASVLKTVSPESSEHHAVMHDGMPILVDALNNDIGIPKGDVMISLLNNEHMDSASWISRVDEAIWRCRTMRRHSDTCWLEEMSQKNTGIPSIGRTSVCVDVDDARVVGGIEKIADTQKAAIEHLKFDDFDDALALYEDIRWSYEQYADEVQSSDGDDLKNCVAAAQYNLGIIHLLRGEHEEALEYFECSTRLRADCRGIGHVDHVVSLNCLVAHAHLSTSLLTSSDSTVIIGENRNVQICTGRLLDCLFGARTSFDTLTRKPAYFVRSSPSCRDP
jgi:hypothetical protein